MKKVITLVIVGALLALCATISVSALTMNPSYEYITIEAENANENTGAWTVKEDAKASGGKYISTAVDKSNSPNPKQCVKYVFNVKAAGKYKIFLHVATPTEGESSVHFKLGKVGARTEHLNNSDWFWNYINNDNPDAPVVFDLPAGENVLQIYHREPDVRLDKMIITNDPDLKVKDI